MRPGKSAVVALVAAIVALPACKDSSGDARTAARSTEPRASRSLELRDGDAAGSDGVLAAETIEAETSDDAAASPAEDVAAIEDVDAPEVVTAAMCRTACQNALRLTLAELPIDAAATMRKEVTEALETVCPTQCVKRGSLASVRCVEGAQTALELAACPR